MNLFAPAGTVPAAGPATVTVNDTDSVNQTTAIAAKVRAERRHDRGDRHDGGGTGSGVVLTEDGYVVTNTHVVTLDGATADATIRVTTSDGRVYDAEVVGTDPTYDLAVIKLQDAEGLTPIEFADSSELNVGDETIAVGAPLGLSNTVTTGIVSALNRSIQIASSAAPDSSDAEGDAEAEEPTPGGRADSPFFFDFGQGDPASDGDRVHLDRRHPDRRRDQPRQLRRRARRLRRQAHRHQRRDRDGGRHRPAGPARSASASRSRPTSSSA